MSWTPFGIVLRGLLERQGLTQRQLAKQSGYDEGQISRWCRKQAPSREPGRAAVEKFGAVLEPGEPGATAALHLALGTDPDGPLDLGSLTPGPDHTYSMDAARLALARVGSTKAATTGAREHTPRELLDILDTLPARTFKGELQSALDLLDEIEAELRPMVRKSPDAEKANVRVWRERSRVQVEVYPRSDNRARTSALAARELIYGLNRVAARDVRSLQAEVALAEGVCARVAADAGIPGAPSHHDVVDLLRQRELNTLRIEAGRFQYESIWLQLEEAKALIGAFAEGSDPWERFVGITDGAIEAATALMKNDLSQLPLAKLVLANAHETRARGLVRAPQVYKDPDDAIREAHRNLALGEVVAESAQLDVAKFQIEITKGEVIAKESLMATQEIDPEVARYFKYLLSRAPSAHQRGKVLLVARRYNLRLEPEDEASLP